MRMIVDEELFTDLDEGVVTGTGNFFAALDARGKQQTRFFSSGSFSKGPNTLSPTAWQTS